MQGPAAGAETHLLKGQAAVAVTVEGEVVRRGRASAAGCCRCSRCEVVLATLLALAVVAVVAVVALGYLRFTQDTDDASNSHRCYPVQWVSSQEDYDVFTVKKSADYYIYAWIASSTDHIATAVLKIKSNTDNREISTQTTFKHWTVLSANANLQQGHKVSLRLQSKFTTVQVCFHELPAMSK